VKASATSARTILAPRSPPSARQTAAAVAVAVARLAGDGAACAAAGAASASASVYRIAGEARIEEAPETADRARTGRVAALVSLLGHQPPALFCKARAVDALQLDPTLIDRVEDQEAAVAPGMVDSILHLRGCPSVAS
jgi:hypothetical protein